MARITFQIPRRCRPEPRLSWTGRNAQLRTFGTSKAVLLARNVITAPEKIARPTHLVSRVACITPPRARYHEAAYTNPNATVRCNVGEFRPGCHVAMITISNPKKLNVVSTPLLEQIAETCDELSADPSLRAVVLTGGETAPDKAPAFIGGADINEMYHIESSDKARQFITGIHRACGTIRHLPVPVIARVDGFALGAGLEIMAACDLRIATKASTFAMPEVRVGIPSVVEAALLPGLIGMGRTRRLLYLAESIDAPRAETWGLVDRVVSDGEELDAAVEDWVGKICDAGPKAIMAQKQLMLRWEDSSVSDSIYAGIESFESAWEDGGVEPREYMGRFLRRMKR